METLVRDLRYGLRMLARKPGFTLIAIIALALGIGANTAIFSVVNTVLLQPLPYNQPERLMKILQTSAAPGKTSLASLWPYPRFVALKEMNESLAGVAAYAKRAFNLTGTDEPEHLQVEFVSASYFPVLGVEAIAGRTFSPDEDQTPGTHPVALIGYGLWQRRYGGDASIVGKTIEMDKHPLTVVGVLPKGFKGQSGAAEVWMPTVMIGTLINPQMLTQPRIYWAEVIGRLKPDVSMAQAQAEMETLNERIEKLYPGPTGSRPSGSGKATFTLVSLKDANVDPAIRRSFLILLAAVSFVLLITCVNTASLLLARAVTRRKEFAIRLALGAGRGRIIRQLLTESVLLALVGGGLGVLVALWGVDLLTRFKPSDNAQFWTAYARTFDFFTIRVDGAALAFNFLLAVVTGILFGLIPALRALRPDVNEALKEGTTSAGANAGRRMNARSILVIAEIALSMVLLIGAGVMIRSVMRLNAINLGFNPTGVITMQVYSRNAQTEFYQQLLERVRPLLGIEAASVSSSTPLNGYAAMSTISIEGQPEAEADAHFVGVLSISPDYFNTLGIALLTGRGFTEQDRIGTRRVGIINQASAARFFPNQDAIGKRIKLSLNPDYPNAEDYIEIVGIADNVKYGKPEDVSGPDVYLPYLQPVDTPSQLIVRANGDRATLVAAVRREVRALDKNMPVYGIQTMTERAAEVTSRTRFSALLLALFAGLALALSAIGIYGVMAYSVAQRTREIGIRMALGAQAGNVFRLVLSQGISLTFAGLGIGLMAAFATTRALASQLYGVSATDPATFAITAIMLVGVALGACFVPARRAIKVDPMIALRDE